MSTTSAAAPGTGPPGSGAPNARAPRDPFTAGLLLRVLPHAGARRLGRALGALGAVSRGARERAEANLHRVFPELAPAARRALARRSFAHHGAELCDLLSAGRFDPRGFCRRLSFEDWERLAAAGGGGGVVVPETRFGMSRIAALAVGLYHGPYERDAKVLEAGGSVGYPLEPAPSTGEGVAVSFLGREVHADPAPARLALAAGAPIVPVFAFPEPAGRYRVAARAPLTAAGTGDDPAAVADLVRGLWRAVETEVRARPELWPWWLDFCN